MSEAAVKTKPKKIKANSVPLVVAGELLFAKAPDRESAQIFQRYEALLEILANMEKAERIINYKFLVGLMLTSHAKKITDIPTRKGLFDLKNELFFDIANHKLNRRKLAFKYLISKNFRVLKFCSKCEEENAKSDVPRHQWKFCKDCEVDRKFYNVLSMHHKFDSGSATLFLSNELIGNLQNFRLPTKGKLEDFKEEARFKKYHYNVKNMDIFELESIRSAQKKLLSMS